MVSHPSVSEMTPTRVQVLESAPPWAALRPRVHRHRGVSSRKALRQACGITSVKAAGYSGQEHGPQAQAAWVPIPALLLTTV